jgi:hypothetical protein
VLGKLEYVMETRFETGLPGVKLDLALESRLEPGGAPVSTNPNQVNPPPEKALAGFSWFLRYLCSDEFGRFSGTRERGTHAQDYRPAGTSSLQFNPGRGLRLG